MTKKQKKVLIRIIVAAVLIIAFSFLPLEGYIRFICYMVPYLVIGYDVLRKAIKGILNRQVFDENFLMAVATVGAIALGAEKYPALIWRYIKGLQKMMMYLCVVNNQRMNLSAEDCYRWFCQKWPVIDKMASNQQIASFLRIRPESLSRLRRQVKENEKDNKVITNVLVSKDLQSDYLDIRKIWEKTSVMRQ